VLKAYSTPRVFEAGQDWHYGSGVDWAGLLVSRLNKGKTLGQYMEENVFRPVGATDSTFHPKQRPDLEKKRLEMVGRSSTGGFESAPPYWPYPEDATGEAGGLGLFSTVPDLIKVIGDLASKSPILLKAASIDLMFTPQFQSHEGVREGLIRMQVSQAQFYPRLANDSCTHDAKQLIVQFMYQNLTGQGPLGEDGKMNVAQGIGGTLTLQDTANLPKNTLTWGGMPHLAWFVNRDLGVAGIFASQLVPPGDRESNAMIASFFKEMIRQASQTGI
jgi:CubicO group peptidase (beta-lactamase class C family)